VQSEADALEIAASRSACGDLVRDRGEGDSHGSSAAREAFGYCDTSSAPEASAARAVRPPSSGLHLRFKQNEVALSE